MATGEIFTIDSIDRALCQFENGVNIGSAFELLKQDDYTDVPAEFIEEINRRGKVANEMYKMSRHRELMLASGFNAGMYIARFDENEEMISFEFTDEARRMLGYDGLDDLPNEFDSWVKTLIPEKKDTLVKLFWDTVKIHRDLPDISHAEYQMVKKDGSLIWVTGAGEFVRREDGSLEIYMGCYRDVTAEHESNKEILRQNKLLKSVAGVYYSLHEIDLINDTTTTYNSQGQVGQIVNNTQGAVKMMREVMAKVTDIRYVAEALDFTNLTTLPERMTDKKIITAEFVGNNIGWFSASFITVEQDEQKRPTKVIFTTRSIDDIKRKEESLLNRSNTDELTGAYNRRYYEEILSDISKTGIADDFVYISVDVNGLKVVNDSIGHNAGDELIVGAYSCLIRCFGAIGKVFRTGGDEFIVLANAGDRQLMSAIDNLNLVTEEWSGDLVDTLSMSYGVVTRQDASDMSAHEIAILADQRMYEDKTNYYRRQGVDRRGQREAHTALCALYSKILKINISEDTYQIINMDEYERTEEKGFPDKISVWLKEFGESGRVHPDDLKEYLEKTKLESISEYFSQGKTSLHIFYRRKINNCFKQVMMELIPTGDFSADNQSLFLYVKDIDK